MKAKKLVIARLDKMLSREALSVAVVVWGYLEKSLPGEWLAIVSAVLIAGLSLEKSCKAIWGAKIAIQNAKQAESEAVEIIDSQDEIKAAI